MRSCRSFSYAHVHACLIERPSVVVVMRVEMSDVGVWPERGDR